MTTYSVRHSTRYEYELPVLHAHHLAHLRPRTLENQTVHATEVEVTPKAYSRTRKRDYFGNDTDTMEVLESHDLFEVTSRSIVTVRPSASESLPFTGPSWEEIAQRVRSDVRCLPQREYCFDSPLVRAHRVLQQYAVEVFAPKRPVLDAVRALNSKINEEFTYEPFATDVSTPLGKVMRERRGVCQDFAHVAIGCLRSVGLPARYVSGYLETIPPAGQEKLLGADASHAWASVFIPEHGWFDIDPTNDVVPGERHITAAWGRDFSDVSPLKGVVVGGGNHRLSVGVDVEARAPASPA